MAEDNNVENPGANDELPGIPVPDQEVSGTTPPGPDIPDDDVQGTPVPDEEISGAPLSDEEAVYGSPAETLAPKIKRPSVAGWRGSRRWPLWMVIGCLLTCCLCCILPLCLIAAVAGTGAAIFKNNETTSTQTETLTVDPNEPLILSVDGTKGSVEVRSGGSGSEVTVTSTKRAYGLTKSAAEKELERIGVTVDQPTDNANTLTVTVDTEDHRNALAFWLSEVDLTITIPDDASITVNNDTGRITVTDVSARALDLHSNTGSITFNGNLVPDVASPLEIQTNTGSISVILPADTTLKISAETNTGNVSVSNSFAQMADVAESHDGAGAAWTGTLGDSAADAPTLRLHTNTGSISVGVQ